MPDWYPLLRAARYMKVAPWDLARQSVLWTRWANMAESAENEAQEVLQQQAQQRHRGTLG